MSSLLDPRREAEASAADDLERLWAASPDAAPASGRDAAALTGVLLLSRR